MELIRPELRPRNPCFSSGPCSKPPGWRAELLENAPTGRSHRSAIGKERLRKAIDLIRDVLEVPDTHRIGIVPASDTGAMEMAMWSLLGERPVEVLAWEAFGNAWASDVITQLGLSSVLHEAEFGKLPDFSRVNFDNDVVLAWNGTTSGVRVPVGTRFPEPREGLVICDATSAVFAMHLPWEGLDATTFSWQKALGGEAAHGVLILSPKAVKRLESWTPAWPMPKIFQLTKNGKLIEGIFEGRTINTPSMLCVEDVILSLEWARQAGGLAGLVGRVNRNARVVDEFVSTRDWIGYLAETPDIRSTTSVCLSFSEDSVEPKLSGRLAKAVASRLESEQVAYDIGAYRSAPPGLRVWCGSTVEFADLEALMPWIEWAYSVELAALNGNAKFLDRS